MVIKVYGNTYEVFVKSSVTNTFPNHFPVFRVPSLEWFHVQRSS